MVQSDKAVGRAPPNRMGGSRSTPNTSHSKDWLAEISGLSVELHEISGHDPAR